MLDQNSLAVALPAAHFRRRSCLLGSYDTYDWEDIIMWRNKNSNNNHKSKYINEKNETKIYSSTCDYISDNNLLRNLNGHRLKYSKHFRSVFIFRFFTECISSSNICLVKYSFRIKKENVFFLIWKYKVEKKKTTTNEEERTTNKLTNNNRNVFFFFSGLHILTHTEFVTLFRLILWHVFYLFGKLTEK